MTNLSVTAVDLVVLAGYVIGTRILFGWYFARKTRGEGAESYFLADRGMRWPIIGLSFYVTNMSGSTFIALPASGYNDGIAAYNYEWVPVFLLIFFMTFLLPLYLKTEVFTSSEFLQRRYGAGMKLMFSAFQLLANIVVDAAAALYAGAMVAQALYPSIPLWITIAATAAIAGIYIASGGLGAVVINDALQAAMILIGGTVVAVLAFLRIPSWDSVKQSAPENGLHLIQPASDEVMPWPGIFTGVLIIGIYFWCSNQVIIQRSLGAKSLDHGRWGSLFAGLLKLPNLFILILPGVMATQLYPELKKPDLVFPTLVFDLLPVGVRGLLLAAIAAAILSSLEAIFNSASTLFTMDFVRTWRPNMSDRGLARTGRWATLGTMVLSAAWAPVIATFPTLWQYLQSILAYVTPPVVAILLLGVFWRRASAAGAMSTLGIGVPVGLSAWYGVEVAGWIEFQYLYACGIAFGASCLILVGVSLVTSAPDPESIESCLWRPRLWRAESEELQEKPWYLNYRYMAAALSILTGAIVIWWW